MIDPSHPPHARCRIKCKFRKQPWKLCPRTRKFTRGQPWNCFQGLSSDVCSGSRQEWRVISQLAPWALVLVSAATIPSALLIPGWTPGQPVPCQYLRSYFLALCAASNTSSSFPGVYRFQVPSLFCSRESPQPIFNSMIFKLKLSQCCVPSWTYLDIDEAVLRGTSEPPFQPG